MTSSATEPQPQSLPVSAETEPCDEQTLCGMIEAILLTADKPIASDKLAEVLGPILKSSQTEAELTKAQVEQAINAINHNTEQRHGAFRIEKVAGGYRAMTLERFVPALAAMNRTRASSRLSRAALETLAIIAYRQPITRAQLEAIRGVACGEVLRSLLDRRLVTIAGRAEELGRPMLYATSRYFLDTFGLATIKDLPSIDPSKEAAQ